MKKLSAVKTIGGDETSLNYLRALYGRLAHDESADSLFWIANFISARRCLDGANCSKAERKEASDIATHSMIELGGLMANAIEKGDARFFRNIAELFETFPLSQFPDAYWPEVSPEYFTALVFRHEHKGEFTRDELAAFIEESTGDRPPPSTITEIMKQLDMKALDRREAKNRPHLRQKKKVSH